MPGPSGGRRGARLPWPRRWGAVRRRVWTSVRQARCARAGKLRDRGRPRRTRAAGPAGVSGDPRAVWVNGAVGEPEVVGPAGAVWVTSSGAREAEAGSPPGRGARGRESILELWLKVQAMRVASGCWEGSRVELHPVPEGEGPVERGVPGRASWIETSGGGVTGPWVRGQVRAYPRTPGLSTVLGLRAICERASGFCGQGPVGRTPSAGGGPGVAQKIGCAVVPGPSDRGQPMGVPEVVGGLRALGVERACGGAPGLCGGGHLAQAPRALALEAVCGDTPGLWERGRAAHVPDALVVPAAVEEETAPMDASGMWHRRREVEDIGTGGIPGPWGTGQPVEVPCAGEEGARCRDDPGSWGAAQSPGLPGSREPQAGFQGVQGLWNVAPALGAPRALEEEADDASVPGLWGTGQLPGVAQTVVVPGDRGEDTRYSGVSELWEREQAPGAPLAEAVPGLAGQETPSGNVLSHWERRQAMRELEAPQPAPEDAGCGAVPCLCGRRQAMGVFEAVMVPKHRCAPAGRPMSLGVPTLVCQESSSRDDLNLPESTYAARMPVASGRPLAPEEQWSVVGDTSTGPCPGSWVRRSAVGVPIAPEAPGFLEVEIDSEGLSDRRQTARVPITLGTSLAGRGPVAPRTRRLMQEETGSGRVLYMVSRPTAGVSMALGVPESMGEEVLSEGLGGRLTAEIPVTAGVAVEVPTAGLPGPQRLGDCGFGEDSGIGQRRQATEMSTGARVPRTVEVEAGSEGVSGLWRRCSGTVRGPLPQEMLASVGVSMAGHVPAAVWVPGSSREEAGEGVSGQTVVRRQSTGGTGVSGEEMWSRGILGLAGRGQATGLSYTSGRAARLWGSPGSIGEEAAYENIPVVSGMTRMAVPLVSREETHVGHFRNHLQQSEIRAVGGMYGVRARGNDLGENYVGEERLRGAFH